MPLADASGYERNQRDLQCFYVIGWSTFRDAQLQNLVLGVKLIREADATWIEGAAVGFGLCR